MTIQPGRFPAFIWDSGPTSFYGFPALDGESGGLKVGVENAEPLAAVGDVRRQVTGAETTQVYDTIIRGRLPGLSGRCLKAVTCMYTTTPDGDFVIDRHPELPSVLVLSACSGHGFKHSAAIGEAVAATLTGEASLVDLSPFSGSRLWDRGATSPGQGAEQEHRQPAANERGRG